MTATSDDDTLHKIKSAMDPWPMASSVYPTVALTILYLTFVTYLGPNLLRKKKPMDLSGTLIIYNGVQVLFCVWWLLKFVTNWNAVKYVWRSVFESETFILDEMLEKQVDVLGYYYMLSKYVELLETVFFILRHKWSQVSYLHVYHHAVMAVSTWFYVKYVWGRTTVVISSLNIFVHTIMYSYYLLSSLGPNIRPNLWWKRYITWLQLGQFLILLGYLLKLLTHKRYFQKTFVYYSLANLTLFLILFTNFYLKTYKSDKNLIATENVKKK